MVADLVIVILPGIQMQMLIPGVPVQSLAYIHVIQLLGVHVEKICISLHGINSNNFVEISEAGYRGECGERVDLGVLVEVTSNEDISRRILTENLGDKVL